MTETSNSTKIQRVARLRWVPIAKMKVGRPAQRELRPNRVNALAADFDLEQLGFPTVNEHADGSFHIVDGQHRIEALRQMGWGDQQIQCQCYDGMSEDEEAEMFLKLDNQLPVDIFDRFRVGVTAKRDTECDIDRIVQANDLCVSRDEIPGAIRAVGALWNVYSRSGPKALGRTLRIVRDAYGDPGLKAPVVKGIGRLCERYNGELDDAAAVQRLSKVHGGVGGLLGRAEKIHLKTGINRTEAVAAAAVDVINVGKGKKLPSWWKE